MQQPQVTVAAHATSPTPGSGEFRVETPPKQVALAMDRLSHARRLIADIRLSADRLLEALFVAADRLPYQSEKPLNLILKEEASMHQHLENLRTVGPGWLSRPLQTKRDGFSPTLKIILVLKSLEL
ncbi:hypothetical protein MRB53_008309 [Persea americana]|uniref:Uncharacterized protein n=1 Tax=Persea americana TaxID=3435 RepID=A0ACC2MLP3_PERAE|nr:hypothetical protein MRB53_008309 [Persea americana]